MKTMTKAKLITALVLTGLVLVWILQNLEPTYVHFFFWRPQPPLALLLGLTLLIGIVVGSLLTLVYYSMRKRR